MKAKSLRLTVLCVLETHHVWLYVFILNFTHLQGWDLFGLFSFQKTEGCPDFFFLKKKELRAVEYKNTLYPKRHGIPWMYENGNAVW